MARPRKPWRHSEGRKGDSVAIYEPRLGSDLRWDWREEDPADPDGPPLRRRPWVDPPIKVRPNPNSPVDPVLEREAKERCKAVYHDLRGQKVRQRQDAYDLTVQEAFELYHDPKHGNLPRSRSARTHHKGSREFWTDRFEADTLWNDVRPAHVESAIRDLVDEDMIPTARKRFANLRTVHNWLRQKMRLRGLEDPTLGVDIRELTAGHQPRRPRYEEAEVQKLVATAIERGGRIRVFTTTLADSGARAIQVRHAMRSGLDIELDDPPPDGHAPSGWLLMAGVKGQDPMLAYLTGRARAAIDAAMAENGYLAEWEAEYQAGEVGDYPLLPAGRVDRDELVMEPISDRGMRNMWEDLEEAAGIEARDRRGFHAVRRAWVKRVEAAADIETVTHAGGWSRRDVVESTYVPKRRFQHLERAREIMEEEDDG